MKKMVKVIALATVALMITTGSCFAGWYSCTPLEVGPNGENVLLKVTGCDIAIPSKGWLMLSKTKGDEMLAVILTAISLGRSVNIEAEPVQNSYPIVLSLTLGG